MAAPKKQQKPSLLQQLQQRKQATDRATAAGGVQPKKKLKK